MKLCPSPSSLNSQGAAPFPANLCRFPLLSSSGCLQHQASSTGCVLVAFLHEAAKLLECSFGLRELSAEQSGGCLTPRLAQHHQGTLSSMLNHLPCSWRWVSRSLKDMICSWFYLTEITSFFPDICICTKQLVHTKALKLDIEMFWNISLYACKSIFMLQAWGLDFYKVLLQMK